MTSANLVAAYETTISVNPQYRTFAQRHGARALSGPTPTILADVRPGRGALFFAASTNQSAISNLSTIANYSAYREVIVMEDICLEDDLQDRLREIVAHFDALTPDKQEILLERAKKALPPSLHNVRKSVIFTALQIMINDEHIKVARERHETYAA